MGYSLLTRYNLFIQSGNLIKNGEVIVNFKNPQQVSNMYFDSAKLICGLEDIINNSVEMPQIEEYQKIFERNARGITNLMFVSKIKKRLEKQTRKKKNPDLISFKSYFNYLLKAVANYQNEVIEENYMGILFDNIINIERKQTFLSYAYDDKGLTLALFYYFWNNSGFLYVNWMHNGVNDNGLVTKEILEEALEKSNQLLFLRTVNSELRIRGNYSIRQWCAWEIGNFYAKNKGKKYYTSFYDKIESSNDMLDTFNPMKEVVFGEIQS